MIDSYRNWLPQSAILDGVVETQLEDSLQLWARKWLAKPDGLTMCLSSIDPKNEDGKSYKFWQGEEGDVSFKCMGYTMETLGETLLDMNLSTRSIKPADRTFLETLTSQCIEDLWVILSKSFHFSLNVSSFSDQVEIDKLELEYKAEDFVVKLIYNEIDLGLSIFLSQDFMVDARKVNLPPFAQDIQIKPVLELMTEHVISVGARIGSAKVSLSEVEKMSTGDVLILDRNVDEPLNVTINQQALSNVTCLMTQVKGDKSLKITHIKMD